MTKQYIWRVLKGSGKLSKTLIRESRGAYPTKTNATEIGKLRLSEYAKGKGYRLQVVQVTKNTKIDF